MQVKLIISNLRSGGAEQCVVNLAESLKNMAVNIEILTLQANGIDQRPASIQDITKNLNCARTFHLVPKLFQRFRKQASETIVVVSFWPIAVAVCLLKFLLLRDLRLYYWEHHFNSKYTILDRLVLKFLFRMLNGVIGWEKSIGSIVSICPYLDKLKYPFGNPVKVLASKQDGSSYSRNHICICSRLEESKGVVQSIYSFFLAAQEIDSRLIILGEGSLKELLINLVHDLGIKDRCYFLGVVGVPSEYMRQCALTLVTSPQEGFCNVVAESILVGTGVVSLKNGSVAESICDPCSAIIVENNDTVQIANAITRYVKTGCKVSPGVVDLFSRYESDVWARNLLGIVANDLVP